MAKGQHLSSHQRNIVKRYYEHADTLTLTKLQESVSDLYLAATPKAADKLWATVRTALAKMAVEPARIEKIAGAKDIKALATLVGELAAPGGGKK